MQLDRARRQPGKTAVIGEWGRRRFSRRRLLELGVGMGLSRVLAIAPATATADDPIARGQAAYDRGQYEDARLQWQAAVRQYGDRGDRLNQALSAVYLSLAQQQLGAWDAARESLERAIAWLDGLPDRPTVRQRRAAALSALGRWQFQVGQLEAAVMTWEAAAQHYAQLGDERGRLGANIDAAQALQSLGYARRARSQLDRLRDRLERQPDLVLRVRGWRELGVVMHDMGATREAQIVLQQSLDWAQELDDLGEYAATLLALGHTATDLGDPETAEAAYRWIAANGSPGDRLVAQLNRLGLSARGEIDRSAGEIDRLRADIEGELARLPLGRPRVYGRIDYADSVQRLFPQSSRAVAAALAAAVTDARALQDRRAESYALGQLGDVYERTGQMEAARSLTDRALQLAERVRATDLLALWQWQLGRLLSAESAPGEETTAALRLYRQAVETLQGLRRDLVLVDRTLRFSFRDRVEPVYRQLVALLLQEPLPEDRDTRQARLMEARLTLEALQLAELENFFREACFDRPPVEIEQLDAKAVVLYPIALDEALVLILGDRRGTLERYRVEVSRQQVAAAANEMLATLHLAASDGDRLRASQRLYDWLIRPALPYLTARSPETLAIVPDDILRGVPFAALHDGSRYLVERYALAISPGLQLFEQRDRDPERLRILAGGLTEARQGFEALPGVGVEVSRIAERFPTQVLLDRQFTRDRLDRQLQSRPYDIVHLATHGQFSSRAEDTYLLAWAERINVRDLDRLLQAPSRNRPVELLVLSACQTALGDRRAVLGMAGVAVRSGARSTLATLWSVRDRSTLELMDALYRQFDRPNPPNKAEALRRAQLQLLQHPHYWHPFFWSPFVLIGNWL